MQAENKTTGHTRFINVSNIPGTQMSLEIEIKVRGQSNAIKGTTLDHKVIPAILEALNAPKTPILETLEMNEEEIEIAEKIAKKLGYSQTAYTSSSGLWGLNCIGNNEKHREGVVIKTKHYGFMFVADLQCMRMYELEKEEIALAEKKSS